MSDMSVSQLADKLRAIEAELYSLSYAMSQINFAGETQDPPEAAEDRGFVLGQLSSRYHTVLCADETRDTLEALKQHDDELDEQLRAEVRVLSRDYAQAADIPAHEEAEFMTLVVKANDVWHRAKNEDDWDAFAPYLDKIVQTMVHFAKLKDPTSNAYDVWLNEFEPGSSRAFYDKFFSELKATIVPLIAKIQEKGWQPDRSCIEGNFDPDTQFDLAKDLAELECLDMDALVIEKSLHPFTDSVSSHHAFVTTHIFEDDFTSNVFSMLHEGGHALYEQGVNPAFNHTCLRGGTSMGIHEAQSRFFENIVGRDRSFAPVLLDALKKRFPDQLKDVTSEQFWLAINIAKPSLIRTEADELTYSLHIIIRYEIEQDLFAGRITAKDIPEVWAKKYHEYLGIDVPNNTLGALQDTHWSGASLGYFPTYALGSAYGAQLKAKMEQEGMDFDTLLQEGNLEPICSWLKAHIWQYGRAKDPEELIYETCGEAFDASYFCNYLEKKFSDIYGL